ncbi:MAG: AAA family ATPase [Bacteroidetes bacterium]|nr:AAA family ATPase [Bacteroidota bacterium]
MKEKSIILDEVSPVDLWGTNNHHQKLLQQRFPNLKIVSRGNIVKAQGDEKDLDKFSEDLALLVEYVRQTGRLSEQKFHELLNTVHVSSIFTDQEFQEKQDKKESGYLPKRKIGDDPVIVHGPNGRVVRARTDNQKMLVEYVEKNDIVFALGPAGTGKTYTAVALAVRALKNKEIKRIILARPAVEAGENLGFLPGDLKEKVDPYLRPLYDALDDMIQADKLKALLENRIIEIAPMAFMRGRTLDNCFVILDEAQNATDMQLKMFLTRMGPSAKVIITGDLTQIDLPKKQQSGLLRAVRILKKIKGIKIAELNVNDVVRHKLVKEIIQAYEKDQIAE